MFKLSPFSRRQTGRQCCIGEEDRGRDVYAGLKVTNSCSLVLKGDALTKEQASGHSIKNDFCIRIIIPER